MGKEIINNGPKDANPKALLVTINFLSKLILIRDTDPLIP